ncbi:NAD(P)-dependent oxidoreductase [Mycobacterium sp. 852002-40037_SCH5390672]|uniref:NAD-dependent epimerase/dehydratase family protein n=1 Tax=Mycobacterium sp. 852002-40037_SCH5390672 TaxID=1834089 RepID=UPI000804AF2A|nr:NAD(P)-dependent oxidoreductase [Mycobacterium sp. 852002-40037_SCH5390672]OBB95717.1 epimerase [Mycobacterium sp. 852002-40037_SCH5390672]
MRIFVTGATGAIGCYALPTLVAAGHHVSALARTETKAQQLREQGATPVSVSLFDRDALATALPPTHRAVFTSAWKRCQRVRTEGSAAVVDAAIRAGISRVIQESVVMVYADRGADWIDEDDPTDSFPIARGNHSAEANARRFGDTGADAVVLRFGLFYGRGAGHSEQIMSMAAHHIGFQAGRPDSYVSSIHLDDAAHAVATAINSTSGTYNVVDDNPVTARDNALAMAEAVHTASLIRAPGRLALLLGDRTTSLTRSLRVSNTRLRQTSDWKPMYPSVREGYRAMAAEWRRR